MGETVVSKGAPENWVSDLAVFSILIPDWGNFLSGTDDVT